MDFFEQMRRNRLIFTAENVHRVLRENADEVVANVMRHNALLSRTTYGAGTGDLDDPQMGEML